MTSGHEVARALRAAYLALHRQTNACFAKVGVTADQFVLLVALADGDAMTQQELVRRVGSDPNTIRAMLLLLDRRGLVRRERTPLTAWRARVSLTGKGARCSRSCWPGANRCATVAVRLPAGRAGRAGGALEPRCRGDDPAGEQRQPHTSSEGSTEVKHLRRLNPARAALWALAVLLVGGSPRP